MINWRFLRPARRPTIMPEASIPILVYHRVGLPPSGSRHPDTYVSPRRFARQMAILKGLGFRTVTAHEYAQAKLGTPGRLPARPILLTFDDGSSSILSEALPIMKEYGFTGVVFMVASQLGGPAVWDDELDPAEHRQLNAEELVSLQKEGWSLGSHSSTHARLTGLGPESLREELVQSRKALEAMSGHDADWFAYPYGDFDERVKEAASQAGYRLGFATERGDGFPFSIPRRVISGRNGLFQFLRRLLQARRLARR